MSPELQQLAAAAKDDDAAALQLLQKINLSLCFTLGEVNPGFGTAMVGYDPWTKNSPIGTASYSTPQEKPTATRTAIVRAYEKLALMQNAA